MLTPQTAQICLVLVYSRGCTGHLHSAPPTPVTPETKVLSHHYDCDSVKCERDALLFMNVIFHSVISSPAIAQRPRCRVS